MNSLDEQLERLLRAAGEGSAPAEARAPFGLATRVLAGWRAGRGGEFWNPALLWQGLAAACLVMALSFWPLLADEADPATDYLQLADSTVQVGNKL